MLFRSSYTSLSISTAVPPNAKTWGGVGGSSTSTSPAFSVAADANGIGAVTIQAGMGPGAFDGFDAAIPFSNVPIITAQTAYYKSYGAAQPVKIDISNYSF